MSALPFDFDGVLTTHPSGSFTTLAYLAGATDLSEAVLWEAFAPFNEALLLGRTTHAAVWPSICARVGRDLDPSLLDAAFDATPMNREMLDLAARLRRDHAVGMVTDNKRDRIDRLVALHALDAVFDPIVVSADCGSGKSDAAIFRHALRSLALEPDETVFVDNSPRNLIAANALGMRTIHFDDARNDVPGLVDTLRTCFGIEV